MANDLSTFDVTSFVTKEDVFKASDQLWSQKEYPSPEKVRNILGKGSLSTINKYIKLWRDEEWQQPIPDILNKAINELRKQLKNEAKEDIKKIEAEAAQKIKEAVDKQHLIQLEREASIKQLQDLQLFTEKLKEDHQSLNKKFNEEEKKFYLAEQANHSLERELQEAKRNAEKQFNAQSREYESKMSQLNKQVEYDKKQFVDKINLLEKDKDELKQSLGNQITDLRLKKQELEHVIKQANEKEIFLNAELTKINNQYAMSQEEIHILKNEKLSLSERIHNNEKELSSLGGKLKQSLSQNEELKQQNKELQKQLLDYSVRIGQLEEKILSLQKPPKKAKSSKK